ncbi:MAG: hypothetical protein ACM335_06465 [Deltaproteobacteria bacterium]
MLKFHESLVSAHHNYLVNQALSPGFLLGELGAKDDFWFLADIVPAARREPTIHGRIYDSQGRYVLEMKFNRITENPKACVMAPLAGGFQVRWADGEPLLRVQTVSFANGYLTWIQGKICDREGKIRMEPFLDGIKVFGKATLALAGRHPILGG